MKKIAVLLLILISISMQSFAQREQDSLALVALYNSTGGANWTNKTNWLSSEPISKWYGITVSNNRVTQINFFDNKLKGVIPSEIGNLTKLTLLNLSTNQISGSIPVQIGNLIDLVSLRLDMNQITGTIPIEIGNLIKLSELVIGMNYIEGSIPSQIGNLTNLTLLVFFVNKLSGTIPKEIGNLSKLYYLNLEWNQLSGTVPSEISALINLKLLDLDNNKLVGSIPLEINTLTKLERLRLYNNKFTELPALSVSSLAELTMQNNKFTFESIEPNINFLKQTNTYSPQDSIGTKTDTTRNLREEYSFTVTCGGTHNLYQWKKNNVDIPSATSSTYTISSLNYSDAGSYTCAVTNTVVTGLTINSRPITLTVVDNGREQDSLALVALYNSTGGPNWSNKANWLSSQPIANWEGVTVQNNRVINLFLYRNNLVGFMPPELGDLTQLIGLNLYGNNLGGSIPKEIGNLHNLDMIRLSANQLSGNIPSELGNLSKLTYFEVQDNKLTGSIPPEIGNLINLRTLYLDSNQLSGNIPAEIGNLQNISTLVLRENQLSGNIPIQMSNLKSLTHLILSFNKLSGTIPEGVWDLTNLIDLDLSVNQLIGTIPAQIINLTKLDYLGLAENKFTGTIPKQIGNLTNLRELTLSYNQLSGIIPKEIGNLTNLLALYFNDNSLTGVIPTELFNLKKLQILSLASNHLTGPIPKELGNLIMLTNLQFSNNMLSGNFPTEVNNLSKLRRLLSTNNKFDHFPELSLDSLDFLTLEYNHLTFDDIEPNLGIAKISFTYSPQDSIGKKQNVSQRIGKDYTFSVTCGGSHNQYQWLKNGSVIPSANASSFKISKLQQTDAGSYVCNVTNTVVTGLTISSRPINLTVTLNGRAKDSLALVTLYNTTGGADWTNNTNWLSSEPISSWYGVTVGSNTGSKGDLYDTTSVVSLDLSGNNLKGQIPSVIGDMVALKTLKLDNNGLSGSVPLEINNITSLQTLELSKNNLNDLPTLTLTLLDNLLIDNNQFSFEDIVPNLNAAAIGFTYSTQDSIGTRKDTTCIVGATMRFVASDSAENNIYQWYKDGISISQATSNTYLRSNLAQSDAGSYTCTITNSSAPGLTLYQRPVKLQVSTPTSIKEAGDMGIKIYPNPSDGIVYIESGIGLSAGSRIEVRDISGGVVFQKDWEDNNRQELSLSNLSKGIYFIWIHSRANNYFQKVVIK